MLLSVMKKVLFVMLLAQAVIGYGAPLELFVAPVEQGGNNQNPGTQEKPLATFSAARDLLREIQRKTMLPPEEGAVIHLLPGDYLVDSTLELNYEDNGRMDRRIVYRSYSATNPARLIGGRSVTNFVELSDKSIQERLVRKPKGKFGLRI